MNDRPKESDWKHFRALVPELRERYLQRINRELAEILHEESRTPTEQFWDVEERIREETRILRNCLDGHSRSNMSLSMTLMFRHGMLTEEDLSAFSKDLADRVQAVANL